MSAPLTRSQLDTMMCQCGNCPADEDLYLNARCHKAGVEAKYNKRRGTIEINCIVCKKPIVNILVARELIEA